jgi:hypothetical protein
VNIRPFVFLDFASFMSFWPGRPGSGFDGRSSDVTVDGHRRYRRSYNSLFSTVLTGLRVTLLTGRSSKSYIFSSGGDSEDIVSLWVCIGPPGPPIAGARGLFTSCP